MRRRRNHRRARADRAARLPGEERRVIPGAAGSGSAADQGGGLGDPASHRARAEAGGGDVPPGHGAGPYRDDQARGHGGPRGRVRLALRRGRRASNRSPARPLRARREDPAPLPRDPRRAAAAQRQRPRVHVVPRRGRRARHSGPEAVTAHRVLYGRSGPEVEGGANAA